MSRIEQLRQNLSLMTQEQLRDHIRHIRNDRRVKKEAPRAKKVRVRDGAKRTRKATDVLAKLTPEQRELLLAELEKEAGNV